MQIAYSSLGVGDLMNMTGILHIVDKKLLAGDLQCWPCLWEKVLCHYTGEEKETVTVF